jgi:hypothetical protein
MLTMSCRVQSRGRTISKTLVFEADLIALSRPRRRSTEEGPLLALIPSDANCDILGCVG